MTNKKSLLQANANSIFSANLGKVRFFSIERTKTTLFSYPMTCCVSLASMLTVKTRLIHLLILITKKSKLFSPCFFNTNQIKYII